MFYNCHKTSNLKKITNEPKQNQQEICFVSSSTPLPYLRLSLRLVFLFLVCWFRLVLFWVMFSILCPDRNFNECKTKALVPRRAQRMNQVGVGIHSTDYWQFSCAIVAQMLVNQTCHQRGIFLKDPGHLKEIRIFQGWNWSKTYKITKQIWSILQSSRFQMRQKWKKELVWESVWFGR